MAPKRKRLEYVAPESFEEGDDKLSEDELEYERRMICPDEPPPGYPTHRKKKRV